MTRLCHPRVPGIGHRVGFPEVSPTPADPAPLDLEPSDSVRIRLAVHPGPISALAESRPNAQPVEPECLPDWIEQQAASFKAQETQAGAWMAETMLELAATARFLGAATPEQFETRKQTLDQERLSVRPCPKVTGRYQAWDIVDGRGTVVRGCTDLFDAMMWIQQRLVS